MGEPSRTETPEHDESCSIISELRQRCVGLRESNLAEVQRWQAEDEDERAAAFETHAAALRTVIDLIDVLVAREAAVPWSAVIGAAFAWSDAVLARESEWAADWELAPEDLALINAVRAVRGDGPYVPPAELAREAEPERIEGAWRG